MNIQELLKLNRGGRWAADFRFDEGLRIRETDCPSILSHQYRANNSLSGVIFVVEVDDLKVRNATQKGYIEVHEGGAFSIAYPGSKLRRGRVIDEGRTTPTVDTSSNIGVLEIEDGRSVKVRKLTPRECFRLQGFSDELFDRAASVTSESQLYKQAGNSVTVNVIYEFAKRLEEAKC